MPAKSPHHLSAQPQAEVGHFIEVKRLEAQNTLLKGFLHEVNNALAGIGTLAEVLKGNMGETDQGSLSQSEQNLGLMASAANKAAALQRRIRSFYPYSKEESLDYDIGGFIRENKDLMELMLSHSQRLIFAVAESHTHHKRVRTTQASLWEILAFCLLWIRDSEASKISIEWSDDEKFKISLIGETKPLNLQTWKDALTLLAEPLRGEIQLQEHELLIAF